MLINSVLQTAHVPAVTAAHVLMHDHTSLIDGHMIFIDCK